MEFGEAEPEEREMHVGGLRQIGVALRLGTNARRCCYEYSRDGADFRVGTCRPAVEWRLRLARLGELV